MEFSELLNSTIDIILFLLPIVIPIFLFFTLFDMWVYYAREKFILNQENTLLKIVPPLDVFKTPMAMELFINSLYQTSGEGDIFEIYWKGSVRPWFSLEIVSDGGKVNFYIWTRKFFVGYLESQIYAQYPGIEIIESPDYALEFDYDENKHKLWAVEHIFTEDNSIPIKTYVDYGLDKPSKDEEKVDPITPVLEFLGSIKENQKVWIQIIVRAHKKEDKKTGSFFEKTDLWVDNYKLQIKKIKDLYKDKSKKETTGNEPLTEEQTSRIKSIERAQGKLPFDVGIRSIYLSIGDMDKSNIPGVVGSFKQYSSSNLNGFKPGPKTSIDFWWQDPFGKKIKKMCRSFFNDYRDRAYFYRDFMGQKRKVLVMNSEELATIFHFPGSVALTPNLERVRSRKSNAPSDLPI